MAAAALALLRGCSFGLYGAERPARSSTPAGLILLLKGPDIWPGGDLALAVAAQRIGQLPARPTPDELNMMAEEWRPWRAVAARILWHYYLSQRRERRVAKG